VQLYRGRGLTPLYALVDTAARQRGMREALLTGPLRGQSAAGVAPAREEDMQGLVLDARRAAVLEWLKRPAEHLRAAADV